MENKRNMAKFNKTPLSAYISSMGNSPLLSEEEEKALALKIRDEKIIYWEMILSHRPITEAIADRVRALLQPEQQMPEDLYSSIRCASRNYRQRDTKRNADAFKAECRSFAEAIAKIDLDGVVGDDILLNIESLGNRGKGSALLAQRPPRGSSRYSEYLERVRLARRNLARSKERFIKANLRLVISIARRYGTLIPMEDLVQEGNLGLIKAVDRFDVTFGRRFSTYATWWIRHNINRSIADKSRVVRIPVHVSADINKIKKFRREYESKYGKTPDQDEISRALGLRVKRVKDLLAIYDGHISLDSFESEYNRDLLDLIQGADHSSAASLRLGWSSSGSEKTSESDLEKMLETNESVHILIEALERLRPIEREILESRFELGDAEYKTLRELGDRYALSRERIRQLQTIALQKLKSEIDRCDKSSIKYVDQHGVDGR